MSIIVRTAIITDMFTSFIFVFLIITYYVQANKIVTH